MPLHIEDYALVGDCFTAALVGRDGSVDWLCFPRFDSGACFAALLGTAEHGRWQLAPKEETRAVRRHYHPDTLVLETEFETASGVMAVIDCMPARDEAESPSLVRVVEGKRGQVPVHMELIIRCDYGRIVPWVQRIDGGIWAIAGPDSLVVRTPVPLRGANLTTVADFTVSAGQRVPFTMTWHPSHEPVPAPVDPVAAINDTEVVWRKWAGRCTYEGEWREYVRRSLVVLRALAYRPTGGIVAAVTTSLPEQLGGVRNWDYRFCWLRDATFTLLALLNAGYQDEAAAWSRWLLRAVAGNPADTNLMYGLAGERRLTEIELDWLPGYEGAKPVRIGNAASKQFQLDVYGEVLDAMYVSCQCGLKESAAEWKLQKALVRFVETAWQKPDEGIWEVRGPRRHFTHSKVMAWVAVDRGVKSLEKYHLKGPLERWRKLRDAIHADVCQQGFDPGLNSFVQFYGAKELDASLLMIPLVGFLPAKDPRVSGTVEAIQRHLMRDGFVQRYHPNQDVDGMPGTEGAFLACTFWLADALALLGRTEEARVNFERLLSLCNDVGLLAEEYDPQARRLVGNFPQAFSHVGLVNTAMHLSADGARSGVAIRRHHGADESHE
jgi:GH15 family glucan-1,4-alpha-glucosidase